MENQSLQNNIRQDKITESVLQKIQNGEIKMRSKAYFTVKVAILVFLAFLVFASSVLLVSFLLFSIKTDGYIFLLGFGTRGIYKFLMVLPWFILIFNALLLVALDYFLRRFRFGYHSPTIYLFLGSLIFVTGLSYLVTYTSFHKEVMTRAENGRLPIGNNLYNSLKKSHRQEGILKGEVVSIGKNYLVIKHGAYDEDGVYGQEKIIFPESMNLYNFVKVGDEVFIAMDIASGTEMTGYGVHKIAGR